MQAGIAALFPWAELALLGTLETELTACVLPEAPVVNS